MSWLLNLIPKPYLIILAIGMLVTTHIYAYYKGWDSRDNKAKIELAKETEAKLIAMSAYEKANRELVKSYQTKQEKTKIVYRTIKEKVKDETRGTVCLNGDAGRLWNDALEGVLSDTSTRTSKEATTSFTDEEVITNAIENFEIYKDCRVQLNALIDWHENN